MRALCPLRTLAPLMIALLAPGKPLLRAQLESARARAPEHVSERAARGANRIRAHLIARCGAKTGARACSALARARPLIN